MRERNIIDAFNMEHTYCIYSPLAYMERLEMSLFIASYGDTETSEGHPKLVIGVTFPLPITEKYITKCDSFFGKECD